MRSNKTFLFFLLTSIMVFRMNGLLVAQDRQAPVVIEYIQAYAPMAVQEMIRTGVPASIKIAQGIIETSAGKGDLVLRSNNHFGIKCKSSWTGEKVYHDDDEEGECFRKYSSALDSYMDHSNYLKGQPRYAFLFNYDKNDHVSWAWGLKKAGYATNPIYAQTLIRYIEQYKLNLLNEFRDAQDDELNKFLLALKDPSSNDQAMPIARKTDQEIIKSNPEVDEINNEKRSTAVVKESYPTGVFKLNGSKVLYAKKGASLLAIAKKYKLPLSNLLQWNELSRTTTILAENQLVFIQKKKKTGEKPFHVVKENESLREISQQEGIQLSSLMKLNKLSSGMTPKPGEKISLRVQKKYMPQLMANTPLHVVKKGETLYTISKKYKVSIDSIKEANSIRNDELQVGQKLKILK